jgi:hypothetical protein
MAKPRIEVIKSGHTGHPAAIKMSYISYTLNEAIKPYSKTDIKLVDNYVKNFL